MKSKANVDWGSLPFGYYKTDYNVRASFIDGKWSDYKVFDSEYVDIHMAATCLHYGQEIFEGMKAFEGVDVADLKGQITKLKDQLNDQADGFAFDAALDGAIRDRKGRDVQAIRGMLDVAKLRASKDRANDIKAALDGLYKDKAWAFDEPAGGYPNVRDGGEPGGRGNGGADGVEAAFASMNPNLKV